MGRERVKKPVHPTQKPVRVLKHIIRLASNPGDLIFDPFMGVGSTGVAALQLRRKFLGNEVEPEYYKASTVRLEAVQPEIIEYASDEIGSKNESEEELEPQNASHELRLI